MIKLKDLLKEGKWKSQTLSSGKSYLYTPTGETTSIPGNNDRDAVIVTIKRDNFKIYMNRNKPYVVGNKYDKEFKNTNDLVKWLNKEKAKYLGIDNR